MAFKRDTVASECQCLPGTTIPRPKCFLTSTTLRSRCNTIDLKMYKMEYQGPSCLSSQLSRIEPPSDLQIDLSTMIRMNRSALRERALECVPTINSLLGDRGSLTNERTPTGSGDVVEIRGNPNPISRLSVNGSFLNLSGMPGLWSSQSCRVKSARG